VGISVFKILLHVSRPNTLVLGNIPGTPIFHNLNQYREALRIPSFIILAVESPIYFANSTYLQERLDKATYRMYFSKCLEHFKDFFRGIFWLIVRFQPLECFSYYRILRWVREEEERVKAKDESALKCIILDMTGRHFFWLKSFVIQVEILLTEENNILFSFPSCYSHRHKWNRYSMWT